MSTVMPSQSGAMNRGAPWNSSAYVASTPFVYEADIPSALDSGDAMQIAFNVAGDSDFFWTKFTAFALVGGAATTRSADQLPAVTILITNNTTGRQYSSAPVPLPNMAGNGQFPFILPMVVQWQAFATISIALANEGNADYSNLQLSFIGIKAFTGGAGSSSAGV